LQWLTENQAIVTQQYIANHIKTDKMTTSKVLCTLQEKNFISRRENETDTLAKTVKIIDLGLEILKKALPIVGATDKAFFVKMVGETMSFNGHLKLLYK
jgi:DNA-binding MarR family transcriptional regulator